MGVALAVGRGRQERLVWIEEVGPEEERAPATLVDPGHGRARYVGGRPFVEEAPQPRVAVKARGVVVDVEVEALVEAGL